MAVLDVDFTDVPEGGWLGEGQYQAVVEECTLETSQQTGGQYLKWKFKSTEAATYGQASTIMTSLSEKALWKLRDVLRAIGIVPEGPLGRVTVNTDSYIGRAATIQVVNEPYEGSDGKTYNSHKIANVFTPATGSAAPAPAQPASGDPGPVEPAGVDDDDIPF